METKPTHEQAQLQLQVYDLRREARLREARDWFQKNYIVETIDDAMRIGAPGTETGTFVGMVSAIGNRPARCSTTGFSTKISSLRPTASSSACGSC